MSARAARVTVKVDKRTWSLLIADTPEADPEGIAAARDEGVDIVVLPTTNANVGRRWSELAQQLGTAWQSGSFAASAVPELERLSLPVCLALGRPRLVDAFCAIFPPPDSSAKSPPFDKGRRMFNGPPQLPDPSDIPPFPEESLLDPFGQSRKLKLESWSDLARLTGRCAAAAHGQYIALTLPSPPPGEIDPQLRPWRTVVRLDSVGTLEDVDDAPADVVLGPPDEPDSILDLLQRCLLASCAVGATGAEAVDWHSRAEMLECAGYLLIAGAGALDAPGELSEYFEIGALAARMHAHNVLHGDMHRGNFGFRPDPHPLGERAMTFDMGNVPILRRPPTARERAQDLAILKANCSFMEWEAAKAGYRFKAPDVAPEVFSLI